MSMKRGYYDVFVNACAKYPSNTAVTYYNSNGCYLSHTYSELYGVCEYLAQNLQQLKCNKGAIALVSERNHLIPCIIAAAHKCSTTFMFIDPSQKLDIICKAVPFTVIVTIKPEENNSSEEFFGKEPDKTMSLFSLNINFFCLDGNRMSGIHKRIDQHSFIAMTSGSTGEPKHIEVPVQCIQPNINDLTILFNITAADVIYFSTPLTFDPSMVEILLACVNGASLFIAPEITSILFSETKQHSITVWQTTPSKFFQFSNADIQNTILGANSTLRVLALGGEPLTGVSRLKELKHTENKTNLFTLYGVTEMSCWACAAELDLNKTTCDKEIPLGNCLSETEVIIKPVEEEASPGKILLVSKTRQCYVLNQTKTCDEPSAMKYVDTGDYGINNKGTIYYRGRKDDVIKRFGNKVFLQLIEATVMTLANMKSCSCIWLPKPMLLVVYYSSESINSQELTDFIKSQLDHTHWPDRVIRVDNLPVNSHGKKSKFLLSKLFENNEQETPTTEVLCSSFLYELKTALCRNLTNEQLKDVDFFAVGGTSFLAVSLCNRLSLICPRFGKFILPLIVSRRYTIGQILQMAEKELNSGSPKSVRSRRKRLNSANYTDNSSNTKKNYNTNDVTVNPVDFIVVWSYDTGKCVDASPMLFQSGFNLFMTVGSHSGKVVVFDAIAGYVKGSIDTQSRVEASVLCYRESRTSARGVVGSYDGTIVCFTLEDCREIWRINVGCMIKSKAALCNDYVYIASYDGLIRCINILTGVIKQTIYIDEQAISADLVVAKKQFVLVGALSGVCASVQTTTNTVAWRTTLGSPVFANPVLYDSDKYVVFTEVNGVIHCRTVEKGISIWKYQGTKGNIFSSLYIKGEKSKWQIVFGCHDSKVYSIIIKNQVQAITHWKTVMSSPVYATPCAINNNCILAASNDGKIKVLESETGAILAEHSLPNETFSSPAAYSNYIFIGCRDDHIYSLEACFDVKRRANSKFVNFVGVSK